MARVRLAIGLLGLLALSSCPKPKARHRPLATGTTVDTPFPPPQKPAASAVENGPLRVLRRMPDGDLPLAPHLAVTFSQSMVAVTSHGELAKTKLRL
jgi:hypothetical protein